MKLYQLEIPKPVRRQIESLPSQYRQRIKVLIAGLATNPRPPNAKELRNTNDRYRIRLDQYRIVYRVEDDLLLVEMLKVGKKESPEFYADLDE